MIPNTAERVPLHTSQSVNREIENQIAHSVRWHAAHPIEPLEVHCTMQAVRLLRGHGNASLKDAAAHFLGLDIPKELQRGAIGLRPTWRLSRSTMPVSMARSASPSSPNTISASCQGTTAPRSIIRIAGMSRPWRSHRLLKVATADALLTAEITENAMCATAAGTGVRGSHM